MMTFELKRFKYEGGKKMKTRTEMKGKNDVERERDRGSRVT